MLMEVLPPDEGAAAILKVCRKTLQSANKGCLRLLAERSLPAALHDELFDGATVRSRRV